MERREFNKILCALGGLALTAPWTVICRAGPLAYDVSYIWHPELEAALDYMEQVGHLLGPDIRRKLRIVRGQSGNFGIIYDYDAKSETAAETIAAEHSRTLEENDFEPAAVIEDSGYHELYNIVYGKGPNLDVHKRNYQTVSRHLGPEVKKRLVIEQTPDGQYALVYKRYGDKDSSLEIAGKHGADLKGTGISVSFIRENNNDIVYGESSFLHETLEKPAPSVKKPEPVESDLEKEIESYIWQLRQEGTIDSDEVTSWSAYDFTSRSKLVTINENVSRQAASMIKPFIALAFFHRAKYGSFIYGPKSRAMMERMIQHSSNSATNQLIDIMHGPKAVDRILQDYYSRILVQTKIVEKIPLGGRTYRNAASAHDYSRFLYALWNDQLPYAKEIRRLMALPNGDRLYDQVPNIPKGTLVYHKTGTTARLCGDFGILVAKGRNGKRYPYTMIAIIEKASRARSTQRWIRSRSGVIRKVSSMIYEHMKARYDLA